MGGDPAKLRTALARVAQPIRPAPTASGGSEARARCGRGRATRSRSTVSHGVKLSTSRHQAIDTPRSAITQRRDQVHRGGRQDHQVEAVERPGQVRVEDEDPEEVDRDRDRHREHGRLRAQDRLLLEVVRGDVEAGADGHDRGDDHDLPVAPHERAARAQAQELTGRDDEVDPPQAERQPDAGQRDEPGVDRPARPLGSDDGRQRHDRADDPLAQRDDHQQPVALGDVVRVPRRAALAPLGDPRAGELDARPARRSRRTSAPRSCARTAARASRPGRSGS